MQYFLKHDPEGEMAIFYYSDFSKRCSSGNFGDDINPFLLGRLFSKSIINSEDVCLVGVGTLLNDHNIELLQGYRQKVVFSTGAGYGNLTTRLDNSWDLVCVRGPKSAKQLGISSNKAICDGAVLLSEFYRIVPESERDIDRIFIPHLKSHWAGGQAIRKAAEASGFMYLPPDCNADHFIDLVSRAKLVVSEAMHGAILADTMRVPWFPVSIHEHHRFKWEDWFLSVGMPYYSRTLRPLIWDLPGGSFKAYLKKPYQKLKTDLLKRQFVGIADGAVGLMSDSDVLHHKKQSLLEQVAWINESYAND